ncbi:MAG: hypothetical protein HOP02_14265 [Methylococcaceae bacterium]|nr:hypothetical protein [Methylococcaceae bacterium]
MNTRHLDQHKTLLFLGMACLLTSSLITWEWHVINDEQFSSALPGYESNAFNLERLADKQSLLLPLQEYQEIVNVPLFFEGRQEKIAVVEDAPVIIEEESNLKLTGVILTPQGFAALIRDEQGAYHKLDPGHDVQGWTVANVQKDRVELTRNSESRELTLFEVHHKHDLTAQELEDCFKNLTNLPLEECFKHPEKFARLGKGDVT